MKKVQLKRLTVMTNRQNSLQIVIVLIIICFSFKSFGQSGISSSEEIEIKDAVIKVIKDFDAALTQIALGEPHPEVHIKTARGFFLDRGANVQVSNVNSSNKYDTIYGIDDYLNKVVNSYHIRYAIIKFEAIPYKNVSLKKVYDKKGILIGLRGTIDYRQIFKANVSDYHVLDVERPLDYDYSDITYKRAEFFIKVDDTDDKNPVYYVKLGNITVLKTTKI